MISVKSEEYKQEFFDIYMYEKVYDCYTLKKAISDFFIVPNMETLKDKPKDIKYIYGVCMIELPINYSPEEVLESDASAGYDTCYTWSRLFNKKFSEDLFFRNKSIRFFEKHLTKKTRKNIIKRFKDGIL